MNRYQSIHYSIAKQEFKDQMDPTDLSRAFFVSQQGEILGFLIIRSDEKTLAYDAAENQYTYTSKDEPTIFDDIQLNEIINLPPYDYRLGPIGEKELYETHAFPDPSTTSIYESLLLLRQSAEDNQFLIALAMTNLLRTQLNETQLSIIAHKAITMYNHSSHRFSLDEITTAINTLMIEGLSNFYIGTKYFDHLDGSCLKATLLATGQESFNLLIAKTAKNNRSHIYAGSALSKLPEPLLDAKLEELIPYLEQSQKISLLQNP